MAINSIWAQIHSKGFNLTIYWLLALLFSETTPQRVRLTIFRVHALRDSVNNNAMEPKLCKKSESVSQSVSHSTIHSVRHSFHVIGRYGTIQDMIKESLMRQ